MLSRNPRLLTPPQEEIEVPPHRPVWRSVLIEGGLLFASALGFLLGYRLIESRLPEVANLVISVFLTFLPLGLWLVFSYWRERFVPEPRQRLIPVLVITALAANAIAVPVLYDYLQIDRWLPLADNVNRIIGYTFTFGIIQELTKYIVVRYLTWPDFFRTRLDGVAYSLTSAIGFATVLNIQFLLDGNTSPAVVAVTSFNVVSVGMAASMITGYGLAQVRFGNPTPFLLTFTVAAAALLNGLVIALRSNAVNAGLALEVSAPSPLIGLGISAAVFVAITLIMAFLFNNAEREAREAEAGREA